MTWQNDVTLLVTFFAALADLRSGKIPNWLTYTTAAIALALSPVLPPRDFSGSFIGLLGTLSIYLALHQFAGLGAGDVKLMAAVGALKGFSFALYSTFYIFCAGFAVAVVFLAWRGALFNSLKWAVFTLAGSLLPGVKPTGGENRFHTISFGPVIFVGVAWTIWLEYSRGLTLRFWN